MAYDYYLRCMRTGWQVLGNVRHLFRSFLLCACATLAINSIGWWNQNQQTTSRIQYLQPEFWSWKVHKIPANCHPRNPFWRSERIEITNRLDFSKSTNRVAKVKTVAWRQSSADPESRGLSMVFPPWFQPQIRVIWTWGKPSISKAKMTTVDLDKLGQFSGNPSNKHQLVKNHGFIMFHHSLDLRWCALRVWADDSEVLRRSWKATWRPWQWCQGPKVGEVTGSSPRFSGGHWRNGKTVVNSGVFNGG